MQKWVNAEARSTVESLQPEHLHLTALASITSHEVASYTGNHRGTTLNTGISVIHMKISKYSNEVHLSDVSLPCASLPSAEVPKSFANDLF